MRIRVTLINPADRPFYMAQWDDPVTGKTRSRSTKTKVRRDAERFAARLEDELNAGTYAAVVNTTWTDFVERYTREHLDGQAHKTKLKAVSAFNAMRAFKQPKSVAVVTSSYVSEFKTHLTEMGLKRSTVRGHLSCLRAALNWAVGVDLIPKCPRFVMPSVSDAKKGRAPTLEEFERMLAAVPKVVPAEYVENWRHYLIGLWLSGLRLEESMLLHWTSDEHLTVDFGGKFPRLRIQAASEKGRTFRLLPMTPDFAEFLQQTPADKRRGWVFNPLGRGPHRSRDPHRPTADHAGKVICKIGRAAGVLVGNGKAASAHDLRRAFGTRWSLRVMPKVLQELMRHGDIKTTMQYYVEQDGDDTAAAVWNAPRPDSGNTFGNSLEFHDSVSRSESSERPEN